MDIKDLHRQGHSIRTIGELTGKAADVIEASNLEYTILRPTWFTNADEVVMKRPEKANRRKAL